MRYISEPLRPLITKKSFWCDYLDITPQGQAASYPELEGCKVAFPVRTPRYGHGFLRLYLHKSINVSELKLKDGEDRIDVAKRSAWLRAPDVLRWEELVLISKALDILNPDFSFSGVPLLFLLPFTPICIGDDFQLCARMVHRAMTQVGFQEREIKKYLAKIDARDGGVRWVYDDVVKGWCPHAYRHMTTARGVFTYRSLDNADFPFKQWEVMLQNGAKTIEGAPPEAFQPLEEVDYYLCARFDMAISVGIESEDPSLPSLKPGTIEIFTKALNSMLHVKDRGKATLIAVDRRLADDGSLVDDNATLEVQTMEPHPNWHSAYGLIWNMFVWLSPPSVRFQKPASRKTFDMVETLPFGDDSQNRGWVQIAHLESLILPDSQNANATKWTCYDAVSKALRQAGHKTNAERNIGCAQLEGGGNFGPYFRDSTGADIVSIRMTHDTLESTKCLYNLLKLKKINFVLLPMFIVARPNAMERTIGNLTENGVDVPTEKLVRPDLFVVESPEQLHQILMDGPEAWWNRERRAAVVDESDN